MTDLRHTLIVVEGAHDSAFLGRLLRRRGFTEITSKGSLPQLWQGMIPKDFPADGDRLNHVVAYPDVFARSGDLAVGIVVAGSDGQLVPQLQRLIEISSPVSFTGIAVILDADEVGASKKFAGVRRKIAAINEEYRANGRADAAIDLPDQPGVLTNGTPRVGIYVLPDNNAQGRLETLLRACAEQAFPHLLTPTDHWVDSVRKLAAVPPALATPSGPDKAVLHGIGTLLQPGGSLAVAIRDHPWLPDQLPPSVDVLDKFLADLIETP